MGLLDLLPAAKVIDLGSAQVDVRGLSVLDIRDLLVRFPHFVDMLGSAKLDAGLLLQAGPDVIAAVIASACGNGSDRNAEAVAKDLGAGLQAEILGATLELTMPRGPQPFLALLKAAGLDLEKLKAQKPPQTPTAETASAAPLPAPSSPLSDTDLT